MPSLLVQLSLCDNALTCETLPPAAFLLQTQATVVMFCLLPEMKKPF